MIVDNITFNNKRVKVIYDNISHLTVFNNLTVETGKLLLVFYKNTSTHELFLMGKYASGTDSTFIIKNLPVGYSLVNGDSSYTTDGQDVTLHKTSSSGGFLIGNMSLNGSLEFNMINSTYTDVYTKDIYDIPIYGINDSFFQMSYYNNTNNIVLLPEPSIYDAPIDVTGVLNTGVSSFVYTNDGTAPTVAKYIAYDTLNPPNPFIAVVQDNVGGNVTFDGGFPKFYNANTGSWSSFSQLNPQCKYLHNALKWISNDKKLELGNNKLLVLCDQVVGGSYSLDYGSSGFRKTMDVVCSIAGLEPHYYSANNFPSGFNFDSAFLDQFCGMIMWSTAYRSSPYITPEAVDALLNFRVLGNGMMFITDHGDASVYNYTDTGFYRTANEILRHYSAFFHGNVNRSSVNVGFLRSNYGDHPLYNGLSDAEYISAGGSESNVVVQSLPEYTSVPDMNFSIDGFTTIKILAILDDGNVVYETYSYGLNVAEPFQFINPDTGLTHDTSPTLLNYAKVDVIPNISSYPELKGNLRIGSNIIGTLDYSYDKATDGINFYKFNNNALVPSLSSMGLEITYPVSYTKNIPINRVRVNTSDTLSIARFNEEINTLELAEFSSFRRLGRLEDTLGEVPQLSYARKKKTFDRYMNDEVLYGYPSVVTCKEGESVDISITSMLSNNTGFGLTFANVNRNINCTSTLSGDILTITPTGLAYTECGVEIEFYDENGITQYDSVFVRVTERDTVEWFVFNTLNEMYDHSVKLTAIIENYNLALLRTPTIEEVWMWYRDWTDNPSWARQDVDNQMIAAAAINGETWNYDRQVGIDTYGTGGFPHLIVVDENKYYTPTYDINTTTLIPSEIVVENSNEYINPITNHRFYIGNKLIKYNLVPSVDNVDIKQRETRVIDKSVLLGNDSDGINFDGIGVQYGCTVSDIGASLVVTPTVRKGELSYFEYNASNHFGDVASSTATVNITELDQINAIVFGESYKVDMYKASVTPPDASTILSTWLRTDGSTYYPDPSTATGDSSAWYINGSGNFVQPNNTSTLVMLWSPEKYDEFEFEATLQSSNSDNDIIGLVIAGDYVDEVVAINVLVHTGGWSTHVPKFSIAVKDDTEVTGEMLVGNNDLPSRSGWSNAYLRVKVVRQGSLIKVYRSNWNSLVINESTELTVDISDPIYDNTSVAKLRGTHRYGFCTHSQANSFYKDYKLTNNEAYDASKIGDLSTDIEYEFNTSTSDWDTLTDSVRTTYDYPRKIRNPMSNDLYYLDFPNTYYSLSIHNEYIAGNRTASVGVDETITPEDLMIGFSQTSTFVKFVESSNINILDNNNGTYTLSFPTVGTGYLGVEVDDSQGYKTFERIYYDII